MFDFQIFIFRLIKNSKSKSGKLVSFIFNNQRFVKP